METEARDSDGLVRRSYGLRIRSVNEAERSVEVIASTPDVDSYGEIVAQNFRLERYNTNSVVLFAHEARKLPIGRSENTRVESGQLHSKFFFASEKANPLAENVWHSVLEETLKGVSIGFMPFEVRYEKRDGKDVYVLDDNELFEISMTPVPANPFGLVRSAESGLWVPRDPKWFVDMKAKAFDKYKAGVVPSRDEETNMDPEKLKAELAAKSAELDTATKAVTHRDERIKTLELDNKAANARADAAEKARDEASKRADKLDADAVTRDIKAVIGKKISPEQEAEFTELRREMGAEKFGAFIAKFADLKLTESKINNEGTGSNKNKAAAGAEGPTKLLSKAHSIARSAGRAS